MNDYYQNQFLLQTVLDVEIKISHLTHRISTYRFLEIGDDPNLVQEIENELLRIHRQIKTMGSYFDLSIMPLSKANRYFVLTMHLNEALQYINEIRKKDYGSQQHTREFLAKLRECASSINAVNDLITPSTDVVH